MALDFQLEIFPLTCPFVLLGFDGVCRFSKVAFAPADNSSL